MKTKITSASLKWIQAMVMTAFLSLLFSSQLIAQPPHHGWNWNDSAFQKWQPWNDSILGFHNDSGGTWHDSIHFPPPPPPPPHDSGHVHIGGDTIVVNGDTIILNGGGHNPPPPPPHDSGHIWVDTTHFPPPPPPPHDSGYTGLDTIIVNGDTIIVNHNPPPPPPHDSGYTGLDTIIVNGDTIIVNHNPPPPPPPPHGGDSTGCNGGGHRLADPNSPAAAVFISIYPNPVMESAVLHIENTSGNVTFRMYEMNGRLVMDQSFTNGDFQLSKGNLGAGLYFYEINDGNTNISKGKLIFQ